MGPAGAGWRRIAALGDIPLELLGEDRAGVEAFELMLGGLAHTDGPAVAAVRAGGAGPSLADTAPHQTFDDRCVWIDGDVLTILDATGAAGRADASEVVIGGGDEDVAGLGIRRLFLSSVGHLLGFHDRFLVHAGAVVVNGVTLLVLGESGAGKSTIALAAVEAGWRVLGDDLAILRPVRDRIEVAGVPRPPTVPTDLGARAATSAPRVAEDPRGRAQLSAAVLEPGFHPVDGVLVAGHGHHPDAQLEDVTGRDVHFLLVGSFPPASHPDQLRRAHPVFASAARLPARRLQHGADAGRRLETAAREMERFSRDLVSRQRVDRGA